MIHQAAAAIFAPFRLSREKVPNLTAILGACVVLALRQSTANNVHLPTTDTACGGRSKRFKRDSGGGGGDSAAVSVKNVAVAVGSRRRKHQQFKVSAMGGSKGTSMGAGTEWDKSDGADSEVVGQAVGTMRLVLDHSSRHHHVADFAHRACGRLDFTQGGHRA